MIGQAVQMAYTDITPAQAAQNKPCLPVLPLVLTAKCSQTWISELKTEHQLVDEINLTVVIQYLHRMAGVSVEDDDFDSAEEVVEGAASD